MQTKIAPVAAVPQASAIVIRESPVPAGTEAVNERGALAYWFDIAPEVREEWLDWYQHDHMPSRVGTTFVSGRCYEALHAAASHMVLFETTEPEALLAPSYMALLRQVSDADRQRRGWYSNTIRVTCRVSARIGKGTGSVLGVIRIAGAKAKAADVRRCLADEVVPALARVPRIGAAWLIESDPALRARMDAVRVTGHQDGSADWAVLIEGGHESDIAGAMARLDDVASWRALGLGAAATLDRYRLLYTMSQSDRGQSGDNAP
ncbi:MAG: hypothetical protein IPO58_24350 [Betaproteobacteria bacterium]|nr:hypothetical protein [Betaproteobacteria bacterium]